MKPANIVSTMDQSPQSPFDHSKSYAARRNDMGTIVEVLICSEGGNRLRSYPLPIRLDLVEQSPTGFDWGYGGSGPAQLAIAILADLTVDDLYSKARYMSFKWDVVAKLPSLGWVRHEDRFQEWVDAHPLAPEDRGLYMTGEEVDREFAESCVSGRMSMTGPNHTPGPSRAVHRHSHGGADDDELAGLGWEIEGPAEPALRGQFARAADARLAAEAPTLYEALREIAGLARGPDMDEGTVHIIADIAGKTLAQVEGEEEAGVREEGR